MGGDSTGIRSDVVRGRYSQLLEDGRGARRCCSSMALRRHGRTGLEKTYPLRAHPPRRDVDSPGLTATARLPALERSRSRHNAASSATLRADFGIIRATARWWGQLVWEGSSRGELAESRAPPTRVDDWVPFSAAGNHPGREPGAEPPREMARPLLGRAAGSGMLLRVIRTG